MEPKTLEDSIRIIKIALHQAINGLAIALGHKPKELNNITKPPQRDGYELAEDLIMESTRTIESFQEALNLVLDARSKLIRLGLYDLGKTYEEKVQEQEIQIRSRNQVPEVLEEDRDSDTDSIHVSPPS